MYDNNRSKDVPGPLLKRPYDVELNMASKISGEETNPIEQMPLSELHCGQYEGPLLGMGEQAVKVDMPMGKDMSGNEPKLMKSFQKGESKSLSGDKD